MSLMWPLLPGAARHGLKQKNQKEEIQGKRSMVLLASLSDKQDLIRHNNYHVWINWYIVGTYGRQKKIQIQLKYLTWQNEICTVYINLARTSDAHASKPGPNNSGKCSTWGDAHSEKKKINKETKKKNERITDGWDMETPVMSVSRDQIRWEDHEDHIRLSLIFRVLNLYNFSYVVFV